MRRAAALVALLASGVLAGPVHGEAVTGAELRALAARAADDPAARERIARVDAVDGRPVAAGAIVAGARPDEVEPRIVAALEAAGASGEPGGGAAGARDRAQALLDDRRYRGTEVPRPFTGPLRWLGDRLRPVSDLVDRIVDAVPGGRGVGWSLLGTLLLVAALVLGRRFIRRGAGRSGAAWRDARGARAEDPQALERAAESAEGDGRWEEAVRLRFRAGLLRLDAGEVIAYRPSLTTGEVGRALSSPAFDAIGRDFDAIAYGGRPADREDAAAARDGWRTVLAQGGG